MGRQDEFSTQATTTIDAVQTARATETVNYITDLLGELQTIALVSGLSILSDDIHAVMSKHMSDPAQS